MVENLKTVRDFPLWLACSTISRMSPQPALQHVVMTMGSSLTVVALFNNTTFAAIKTPPEPWRPVGATNVLS
jgi:hypothetical protein